MADITSADRVNLVRNTQMIKEAALAMALRNRQLQMAEQQALGGGPPSQMAPPQPQPGQISLGRSGASDPRMNPAAQAQLAQMLRMRSAGQPPAPVSAPPQPDGAALLGN